MLAEEGKNRIEFGIAMNTMKRIQRLLFGLFFFCIFLAYNGPYVLGNLMLNPSRNRPAAAYRGHHFASFPVDRIHPWQNANKSFHNKLVAMERAACEVSGVDDGVGEIMATLNRLEMDENTLVAYASDQGWKGGRSKAKRHSP